MDMIFLLGMEQLDNILIIDILAWNPNRNIVREHNSDMERRRMDEDSIAK
jgi:hypothetical protein